MQLVIVYIICGLVAAWVIWKLIRLIRRHSPEDLCSGCTGDCSGCGHKKEE